MLLKNSWGWPRPLVNQTDVAGDKVCQVHIGNERGEYTPTIRRVRSVNTCCGATTGKSGSSRLADVVHYAWDFEPDSSPLAHLTAYCYFTVVHTDDCLGDV